jgi:hypothetical protein
MSKMAMSEILKRCAEFKKKEERVYALQQNCNEQTKKVLQLMFHPDVKFALPEGKPPFNYSQFNENNMIFSEVRRLYIFMEGSPGTEGINQTKRERLFIEILQAVAPDDADLLIAMKDKTSPYPGLTKDVVVAAFPEMFPT